MYSPSSPAPPVPSSLRCAGLTDARERQPLFSWTVFTNPGRHHELLRQARNDVGTVFIVALVLDSIYQVIAHSGIYALELLLTSTILALVPYVIVRGLVTRLARRQSAVSRADGRPGNQATLGVLPAGPSSSGTVTARAAPGRCAAVRRRCGWSRGTGGPGPGSGRRRSRPTGADGQGQQRRRVAGREQAEAGE